VNIGVSIRMLREHRWSYAGLAVVLVTASALVGVSLLLSRAAAEGLAHRAGLTRNQLAIQLGQLSSGGVVADYLVFLSVFLAAVLVFQVVGFMIDGRRQEIALLRLVGAKKRQVILLLAGESLVLSVAASTIGALLSLALATPFARLLTFSDNWPAGLGVELHPVQLIACIILVPFAAITGTMAAAIRAVRVPPVAAIRVTADPARRRPIGRLVTGGLGFVGIIGVLLLPFDGGTLIILPSIVGGLAVLVAAALAPFIVPFISAPLGRVFTGIAPGAGLVARERIRFDRHRAGALATPIIILLGLGTVFGMFALTGRAYTASAFQAMTDVQAVAEAPGDSPDGGIIEQVSALPEVARMTTMQSTKLWSWNDSRVPEAAYLSMEAIDAQTFLDFVPARVIAGDLSRVGETQVAVTTSTPFRVGDTFAIESPDGDQVQVQAVAVVESSPLVAASLLVDARRFTIAEPQATQTWLFQAARGVDGADLSRAVRSVVPSSVEVMTAEEWRSAQTDRQTGALRNAVLTIVAGGAIFALVSLSLTILSSARERSRELDVLRKAGARARSVVASVVLETLLASTAALLLGGSVVVLVYLRMRSALEQAHANIAPVVPSEVILGTALVVLCVGVIAAAVGAGIALRSMTAATLRKDRQQVDQAIEAGGDRPRERLSPGEI